MADTLDPQAVALAKAIRQTETGNKPVAGASGEQGRYQFLPGTWSAGAAQYLGDANAPQTLENENKVAYSKIKHWKDQGYKPDQIASLWNSGSPEYQGKVGVNKMGVKYDTPAYVQKVYGNYQKFKPQEQAPPQTQAPQPPKPSLLGKLAQGASQTFDPVQVGIGALKGVGSTVSGLESLGEKLLTRPIDRAVSAITGKPSVLPTTGPTTGEQAQQQLLQPTTTGQKIGKGAEQVAELFTPTGLESAGGNLAAKLAPEAPKLAQGALKVAGKALGGAAEFGGKTAIQTGGDVQKTKEAAITGGLAAPIAEAAGAVARPVQKFLGERLPPKIINSILKPVSKEFAFGRNPGLGVVQEGLTANTREGLLKQISDKKKEIGAQIDAQLNLPLNARKKIDVAPLLKPLDDAMAEAVKSGEQALYTRLQAVRDGLTREFQAVEGKLVPTGEKKLVMTPAEARQLKTEIGGAAKWTGQAFDNEVNQARVKVYRAINDAIDAAVPGTKTLNSRYANLLSAEKSLDKTITTAQRQNLTGLKGFGLGAGLFGEEKLRGKSTPEAFVTGLLGLLGEKVSGSTAVKSRIAQSLSKLAPEEITLIEKIIPLLAKIKTGMGNLSQQPVDTGSQNQ